MKFHIPSEMPSCGDFIEKILNALFPDLDALEQNPTGYGYTIATGIVAKKLGLVEESYEGGIDEECDMFRLLYELDVNSKTILGKQSKILSSGAYRNEFNERVLEKFCSPYSKKVSGWLDQRDSAKRIDTGFEAALVYAYLLMHRSECVNEARAFFEECLAVLGVSELEDAVKYKLFDFSWKTSKRTSTLNGRDFNQLEAKGTVTLATALMTVLCLIGRYDAESDAKSIEAFHKYIKDMFDAEINASKAFSAAERILLDSIKYFEPRSIQCPDTLYPHDFFVMPRFERSGKEVDSPFANIAQANKSRRELVMAKTGMGKTAYLKMLALCILQKKYQAKISNSQALAAFSKKLATPDDAYIIYIPAQMFTFCYSYADGEYREWTKNLAKLYFNSLLKFSSTLNFYSGQNTSRMLGSVENEEYANFEVTADLLAFVRELAKRGKLLLVLDSFDEIPSGEMREAYRRSLAAFYDTYCDFPEKENVGAHVVVSSREMSPNTMADLKRALRLDQDYHTIGIMPLNAKQRKQLIQNWNRVIEMDNEELTEMLEQIESNHFYLDYSVNPYMLSVVCFYFEYDLSDITQRFIKTLVDRMINTNKNIDDVLHNVLRGVERILQEIAGETITSGNPHFSRQKFNRYLRRKIDKTDLTPEDIDRKIETLHEIFVTEVGLIVPADGDDDDYQFINNQIRYELAAKGIQNNLERDEMYSFYHEDLLPSISNVSEYVGFLVPLLCHIKDENLQLAEMLVSDLAFYDFQDGEEPILIEAMLDLLLSRYGSSIVTTSEPGDSAAKYINRAQRMVLIRVLSSPSLNLSDKEKEEFADLPVYQKNYTWLASQLRAIIE